MNLLKLFIALLVSASLVSAAADTDIYLRFKTEPELRAAAQAIFDGDLGALKLRLQEIHFPDEDSRDDFITILLQRTFLDRKWDIAEYLLGQEFHIKRDTYPDILVRDSLFGGAMPWRLEAMKQLVRSYPKHAPGLYPTNISFYSVRNISDKTDLIELAAFCQEVNAQSRDPVHLDPTPLLEAVLDADLRDCSKYLLVKRLLEIGAQAKKHHLDRLREHYGYSFDTINLLEVHFEQQEIPIKEPERL
jgi:hypothetical protein